MLVLAALVLFAVLLLAALWPSLLAKVVRFDDHHLDQLEQRALSNDHGRVVQHLTLKPQPCTVQVTKVMFDRSVHDGPLARLQFVANTDVAVAVFQPIAKGKGKENRVQFFTALAHGPPPTRHPVVLLKHSKALGGRADLTDQFAHVGAQCTSNARFVKDEGSQQQAEVAVSSATAVVFTAAAADKASVIVHLEPRGDWECFVADPRGLAKVQTVFEGSRGGEENDGECCVCWSDPATVTLLPCRHQCVCGRCYGSLGDRCPICRIAVDIVATSLPLESENQQGQRGGGEQQEGDEQDCVAREPNQGPAEQTLRARTQQHMASTTRT
eukprot:m.193292 g.193292  ORF g.193292 m.193292 type:complete len:327 (-) comp18290_c0_seq12:129-1109(-)